ncbi:hypothetical protein [Enterococcus casseliflavus]|uniref:hypothetical protein n=1 Tax=Enterococcus casseliflavus TaxID=37734 RepID=UPI0011588B4B|nr:hypothetical protein [Enterococcus casseliflavus]
MDFEKETLKVTNLIFEANSNAILKDSNTLKIKAGKIKDRLIISAETTAYYKDEKFVMSADFSGKFILVNETLENIETNSGFQEEIGREIVEKIYNKFNLYVSLFSQEVYDIPIYPSRISIDINNSEVENDSDLT